MKILSVDTSSIVATVAIMDEDKLIGEYVLNHKKTHSQKLMPIIKELLQSSEIKIEDIDLYAVANGPGSFTGLRIGVATIKGLAHATGKPVIGISTLEGLAYNIPLNSNILCPIMDARRDQVYNAIYKWDFSSGTLCEIEAPRALSVEELMGEIIKNGEKIILSGDGLHEYGDLLKSRLGDLCEFAPISCRMQRASSIAQLALIKAQQNQFENYSNIELVYLRKPQAEREYEKNTKKI